MKKFSRQHIEKVLPLQAGQKYFFNQYFSIIDRSVDCEQLCLTFNHPLKEREFYSAWKYLIGRHPVLRSVFYWEELREPVQLFIKEAVFEPDLSWLSIPLADQLTCERIARQEKTKGLDLNNRLWRCRCIVSDTKSFLILTHHHILYDGWSNAILIKELLQVYNDLDHKRRLSLEPAVSYYEIAENLRQFDMSRHINREEILGEFKKENFHFFEFQGYKTVQCQSSILTNTVKDSVAVLASQIGITTTAVFVGLWGIFFNFYRHRQDSFTAFIHSGRNYTIKGIESVLGMFIKTCPLYIQNSQVTTVSNYLLHIFQSMKYVEDNQISIQEIGEIYHIPASQCLSETLIVIENYPLPTKEIRDNELYIQNIEYSNSPLSYPITLEISFFDSTRINLKYWPSYLGNLESKRMLDQFLQFLACATKNPTQVLYELWDSQAKACDKECSHIDQYENFVNNVRHLFSKVLDYPIEKILPQTDFFEIGGNSFHVTMLILKICDKYPGISISDQDIYKNSTVAALAEQLMKLSFGYKKVDNVTVDNVTIEKVFKQNVYEMSSAQKRFYFLQQVNPESVEYNTNCAIKLRGDFEIGQFFDALTELMKIHPILKSYYMLENDKYVAKIKEDLLPCFEEISITSNIEKSLADAQKPFILFQPPLWRVSYSRIAENETILFFQMHHIITDEWSIEILWKNLVELYEGRTVQAPKISYFEYINLYKENASELTQAHDYWLKKFEFPFKKTLLTADYSGNNTSLHAGERIFFSVGLSTLNSLKRIIKNEDFSIFHLLCAIWILLISFLTGEKDVIIGTVANGRVHVQTINLVGPFVNILALRMNISQREHIRDWIRRVSKEIFDSLHFQTYQFDDLVSELGLEHNLYENPLFDISFVMQQDLVKEALSGTEITFIPIENRTAKHQCTLFICENSMELKCSLEYRSRIFRKEHAEEIAALYAKLLELVGRQPDIEVSSCYLKLCDLFVGQKREVASETIEYKTIQQLFYEQVIQYSDKVAISVDEYIFTYRDLNEQANHIAEYLLLHFPYNKFFGVYMDNSAEMIFSILGIMKAGRAYLPIDLSFPSKRIEFMVQDSECSCILTNKKDEININENIEILDVCTILEESWSGAEYCKGSPEDYAYVIYTSGSTGEPKGCLCQQQNVSNYLQWAANFYLQGKKDYVFALYSSIAFDLTVTSLFLPLVTGNKLHVFSQTVDSFLRAVSDPQINIVKATPTHLKLLLHKDTIHHNMRDIIVGGEQLSGKLATDIFLFFGNQVRIHNEYGPTECTVGCTVHTYQKDDGDSGPIPIGKPIWNMSVHILNEDRRPCLPGCIGELFVGGKGVIQGYLNRKELTEKSFLNIPSIDNNVLYATGDLAYLRDDGNLIYVGRKDSQIKVRGYRVETTEVENAIMRIPGIVNCAVTLAESKNGNQFLVAYYTGHAISDSPAIKCELAQSLPAFMIPERFVYLDNLPLGKGGKIDYSALPSVYKTFDVYEKSQNSIHTVENEIEATWRECLELPSAESISGKNFFDIGGNSYILLCVYERLKKSYSFLTVADLFRYPTVELLTSFVLQHQSKKESSNIEAVERAKKEPIAIIGIAFNLKHATTWQTLSNVFQNKIDCIGYPSRERINDTVSYKHFLDIKEDSYIYTQAAYLDRIDLFDFNFFGLSKKEAELMDPYQRIMLQTSWHAFENAGYSLDMLSETDTGVYIGAPQPSNYYEMVKSCESHLALMAGPGNIDALIAGRLSYFYNLHGPSMMVNTACSSGLQALYLACNDLYQKRCKMALVGGINLILDPTRNLGEALPEIVSPTARAHTFTNNADGTGRGEGSICLVLKPFDQAIKDHDGIYAIVRGIESNNDGRSIGVTAPNPKAQEDVIERAWKNAGLTPERSGYWESHGTGTDLGDPIEISALTNVIQNYSIQKQFSAVGAAKSNYGHLDSASGLLGIIKTISMFQTKKIYPNIHHYAPNLKIDFLNSPLYLPLENESWDHDEPRVAGISSFGLSGTNCHVVLQEYIKSLVKESKEEKLFILSAKTESSLWTMIQNYLVFLQKGNEVNMDEVCYTLQCRRQHFSHRLAVLFRFKEELISKLRAIVSANSVSNTFCNDVFYGHKKQRNKEIDEIVIDVDIPLSDLARKYVEGFDVDWKTRSSKLVVCSNILPAYPYEEKRCWVAIPISILSEKEDLKRKVMKTQNHYAEILKELRENVANLFDVAVDEIDTSKSFFSIGMDSISVLQLINFIKNRYELDIQADEVLDELGNIESLSHWIAVRMPTVPEKEEVIKNDELVFPVSTAISDEYVCPQNGKNASSVFKLFEQQMDIIQQQLNYINHIKSSVQIDAVSDMDLDSDFQGATEETTINDLTTDKKEPFLSGFLTKSISTLSEPQTQYLKKFSNSYSLKTINSKRLAEYNRKWFANNRSIQGFSSDWKEMVYPILVKNGRGSWIEDIDHNHYIDFAMGFGVHLFGYNHPMIEKAIFEQIHNGYPLGALSELPGQVAELISSLTGTERVAFCNSGTEAVMNLIRIARAATNRNKIVIFSGSFHGTFDGILGMKNACGEFGITAPVSLGTPASMIRDVIVLDYDKLPSLNYIEKNASEIAAVLVEPVQSRNPDLQPALFLKQLRELTIKKKILLLFDEVITGFRIHPGGAQAYFGIKADLVSYGKVIGGGLPIGVFGGKSQYMDLVDGGHWQFEDSSAPSRNMIQSGGTFSHHPLAMAAALAVLNYFVEDAGQLQKRLNHLTDRFASYLNEYFQEKRIPIHIAHFGSQFIFKCADRLLLQFLYYGLIYRGIYVWEGGTCYISSAHTEQEIALLAATIQDIIAELVYNHCFDYSIGITHITAKQVRENSYMTVELKLQIEKNIKYIEDMQDRILFINEIHNDPTIECIYPLSDNELAILAHNLSLFATHQDNAFLRYEWNGKLDEKLFLQAWQHVINSHEILRSQYLWRKLRHPARIVRKKVSADFVYVDLSSYGEIEAKKKYSEIHSEELGKSFDHNAQTLTRLIVVHFKADEYKIIVKYKNSLFDGWSASIIMYDLQKSYQMLLSSLALPKLSSVPYSIYLSHQSQGSKPDRDFWQNILRPIAQLNLEYSLQTSGESHAFQTLQYTLTDNEIANLERYLRENSLTANTVFLGCWISVLCKMEHTKHLITPIVASEHCTTASQMEPLVGFFNLLLPLYVPFLGLSSEWLHDLQKTCFAVLQHGNVTLKDIAEDSGISLTILEHAVYHHAFVFLNYPSFKAKNSFPWKVTLTEEETYTQVPLRLYVDSQDRYTIRLRFDTGLYNKKEMTELIHLYCHMLLSLFE